MTKSTRKYTLKEQRDGLLWLLSKTAAPLGRLAEQGSLDEAEFNTNMEAVSRLLITLKMLDQPYVQEELREIIRRGPPR